MDNELSVFVNEQPCSQVVAKLFVKNPCSPPINTRDHAFGSKQRFRMQRHVHTAQR